MTDAQDCEILLKRFRNYSSGELADYFVLPVPYKANTKPNKLKDDIYKPKIDDKDADGDNNKANSDSNDSKDNTKERDTSIKVQNGETNTCSSVKDGEHGGKEESPKGVEVVERKKTELTAFKDKQQGACGVDNENL